MRAVQTPVASRRTPSPIAAKGRLRAPIASNVRWLRWPAIGRLRSLARENLQEEQKLHHPLQGRIQDLARLTIDRAVGSKPLRTHVAQALPRDAQQRGDFSRRIAPLATQVVRL
jgi:hypothetical protein